LATAGHNDSVPCRKRQKQRERHNAAKRVSGDLDCQKEEKRTASETRIPLQKLGHDVSDDSEYDE